MWPLKLLEVIESHDPHSYSQPSGLFLYNGAEHHTFNGNNVLLLLTYKLDDCLECVVFLRKVSQLFRAVHTRKVFRVTMKCSSALIEWGSGFQIGFSQRFTVQNCTLWKLYWFVMKMVQKNLIPFPFSVAFRYKNPVKWEFRVNITNHSRSQRTRPSLPLTRMNYCDRCPFTLNTKRLN